MLPTAVGYPPVLGYAAENPDELEVVGPEFSEENIGVGYSQDYPEMCQWIVDTITATHEDGTYEEAFNATLGPSGVEVPAVASEARSGARSAISRAAVTCWAISDCTRNTSVSSTSSTAKRTSCCSDRPAPARPT